jgi:hypothetical protein
MCANPFASGLTEASWNGTGYEISQPYIQGRRTIYRDSDWVYDQSAGDEIQGPQEFLHTLSHLVNGLVACGFRLRRLDEVRAEAASIEAEAGSWDHFTAIVPPWLVFWTTFNTDTD